MTLPLKIKTIAAGTDTVLIANGDTKLIEHYKRVLDKNMYPQSPNNSIKKL